MNEHLPQTLAITTLVASLAVVLTGCEIPLEPGSEILTVGDGNSIALADNRAYTESLTDPERVVCNPFEPDGSGATNSRVGLVGSLWFLNASQAPVSSLNQLFALGAKAPADVFMDQLNVPTRAYDTPFFSQAGNLILNQEGTPAYEWFGVRLDSELVLAPEDAEGLYQVAVLSDDGVVLQVDEGSGLTDLISNPSTTPTKMSCATRPVQMTRGQALPIHVDYMQGPRYHIALIVMWRPWTGSADDAECGQSGNGRFFNSNVVPSAPTATYEGLLARGWAPLKAANYQLPQLVAENPCKAPDPVSTEILSYAPGMDVTNQASVTIAFQSNYANATFDCSLNGAAATPCVSPVTYNGLADGPYVFEVHATHDGVRDALGAVRNWRVDTLPPFITFISTTTTRSTIQIDWTTSEPTTAYLEWGTSPTPGNLIPEGTEYLSNRSLLLSGLTPATVYYFHIGGRDLAGNTYRSSRFSSATRR